MITGKLRQDVDRLWEEFWTGGITNPLTVIEQISFLMFARLLDIRETRNERKAERLKGKSGVKMIFGPDQQHLRWNNFKHKAAAEMLKIVRDEVFPHFRTVGNRPDLRRVHGRRPAPDPEAQPAGLGRQHDRPAAARRGRHQGRPVRVPARQAHHRRHQRPVPHAAPHHPLMVEMIDPKPTDVIGDPACGTAGSWSASCNTSCRTNTSKAGIIEHEDDEGNKTTIYTGDLLNPYQRQHIQKGMFHGFDFDVTMLRIAAMNLMLHGIDNPDIHYQDTPVEHHSRTVPQAGPGPFRRDPGQSAVQGQPRLGDVHPSLTGKVKTKKTELLFLALILRMLKTGGRCAVIVPDGVLFGSSNAHRGLRQMLVDENQLEAVISLPSGVFKPYAGVSTAILVFTKGGRTDNVFFYDVERDGFSLDDKRTPLPEKDKDGRPNNDLPDLVEKWRQWDGGRGKKHFADRKARAFCVPRDDIAAQDYDCPSAATRNTCTRRPSTIRRSHPRTGSRTSKRKSPPTSEPWRKCSADPRFVLDRREREKRQAKGCKPTARTHERTLPMPNELQPSRPEGHQSPFEQIRRTNPAGVEFWSSRDFAQVLGYADYRNFEQVIQKARTACFNSAHPIEDHFVEITEMVQIGSGAMRPVQTVYLSRYACYLIVQNADPAKEIVALGQTYFAIQTRRQELTDQATEAERRLLLREEMKLHNVKLAGAAKDAGRDRAGGLRHFPEPRLHGPLRRPRHAGYPSPQRAEEEPADPRPHGQHGTGRQSFPRHADRGKTPPREDQRQGPRQPDASRGRREGASNDQGTRRHHARKPADRRKHQETRIPETKEAEKAEAKV